MNEDASEDYYEEDFDLDESLESDEERSSSRPSVNTKLSSTKYDNNQPSSTRSVQSAFSLGNESSSSFQQQPKSVSWNDRSSNNNNVNRNNNNNASAPSSTTTGPSPSYSSEAFESTSNVPLPDHIIKLREQAKVSASKRRDCWRGGANRQLTISPIQ